MSAGAPTPCYATFTSRLIACTIDLCLLMLFIVPVSAWLSAHAFPPANVDALAMIKPIAADATQAVHDAQLAANQRLMEQMLYKNMPQIIIMNMLQVFFIGAYTAFFWIRYSRTPGKMLLGLNVCDSVTGARMTRKQAVLRLIGYVISFLPLTLGFLWTLLNRKKQGWHDILAHTVVVRKSKTPPSA